LKHRDGDEDSDDEGTEPPPNSAASIESLESTASTVVPDDPVTPGTPGVVFAGFQRQRMEGAASAPPKIDTSVTTSSSRVGDVEDTPNDGEVKETEGDTKEKKHRTFYIKIRDFGFAPDDPKFSGIGENVPKENRVGRLNRVLRGAGRGYGESTSTLFLRFLFCFAFIFCLLRGSQC
jgi:hypothetical protein